MGSGQQAPAPPTAMPAVPRLAEVLLLATAAFGLPQQGQFQTRFSDYDDATTLSRDSSGRGRGGPPPPRGGSRPTEVPSRRETTTQVEILKQINEHNEDGSYTYGYEGSDGSFKLETRFADGRVQGKYGYLDVNGEVKIIEYGADAMGFAPSGDLPDGIVIPEPVANNCTDADGNECDYDYDYPDISPEEESRRQIVNRARNNANEQSGNRDRPNRNQNRGQQISQPITPAPLPRQNRPVAGQSSRPQAPSPARTNTFSSFQPAPPRQLAPSRQAAPARQSAPPRQPAPQPAFQPAAFLPTPPPSKPASGVPKNPGSSPLNPARGRGSSGRGGSSSRARPAPQASRPQASRPSAPVPSQPQAAQAGRLSSSTGFSNFPARGGGGTSRQQVAPRAPPRQAAPPHQSAPRLQERPAPALPPPSFQNFGQQANTQSNFQTRPAAPPPRPALTFQDTPSSPLPPSALEVVDFNELLGVFQGQGGSSGQGFSSGSSRGFPAQAAVPQRNTQGLAVFQPQNFPARLY